MMRLLSPSAIESFLDNSKLTAFVLGTPNLIRSKRKTKKEWFQAFGSNDFNEKGGYTHAQA